MRESPQTTKYSPPRALVVDDDDLLRWALVESLKDAGYEVCEAGNGREAMSAVLAGSPFQVILLDFVLPDSSDLRLLNALRHLSPDSQLIVLTGYDSQALSQAAVALGAQQVLAKPFDLSAITALVHH